MTGLLVVLCGLALVPSGAAAASFTEYHYLGEFGSTGSGDGQFLANPVPQHIAVSQATGYVYVADSGNGRVEFFKPAAGACTTECATYVGKFGEGALDFSKPVGLAIDESDGDVYATSSPIPGTDERQTLTIEGASAGTYRLSFEGQSTGWSGEGTLAAASNTVTGFTTTTGTPQIGEEISGTGISPGTTISGISGTTITLSQATEAGAGGVQALTSDLTYKATSAQIRAALGALPAIDGPENVAVSGSGSTSPITRTVEFTGALADTDVAQLACDGTGLTGTAPTCGVATTTPGVAGISGRLVKFAPDDAAEPTSYTEVGIGFTSPAEGFGPAQVSSFGEGALDTGPKIPGIAVDPTGGDVLIGSPGRNEAQAVRVSATAGQFRLTFDGEATADIAYNATAGAVQTALRALPAIGSTGVTVSGGPGGPGLAPPYVVSFAGPLTRTDVEQLGCQNGTTALSGGGGCSIETTAPGAASTVKRFDSSGAFLGSFDGTGGGGTAFVKPIDVAVDSIGDVIVADATGLAGTEKVLRYDAAGELQATLISNGSFFSGGDVAVDPQTDEVFVASRGLFGAARLEEFKEDVKVASLAPDVASKTEGKELGLAVGGPGPSRLYLMATSSGATGSVPRVQVWEAASAEPHALTVTKAGTGTGTVTSAPAGIDCGIECSASFEDGETVILSAAAGPNTEQVVWSGCTEVVGSDECKVTMNANKSVTATFALERHALTVTKGGTGTGTVTSAPAGINCGATCSAEFDHGTPVTLAGVAGPNTKPVVWSGCDAVDGENRCQVTMSGARSVTATFSALPAIGAVAATQITESSAKLTALVNPGGSATSYWFEYGESTSYGSRAPASPRSIGEGTGNVEVSQTLEGLRTATTYHYRLVAESAVGRSEGEDHSFTTFSTVAPEGGCPNQSLRGGAQALLPDCRAYELVSPSDKGSSDVKTTAGGLAAPSGDLVTYAAGGAFSGAESAPLIGSYLSRRGASGWSTEGIAAPAAPPNPGSFAGTYSGFAEDLSAGLFLARTPLQLFLRDFGSSVQEVAPGGSGAVVMGATPDFSTVVFSSAAALTPTAPVGGNDKLYESAGGAIRLVSVMPDGTPTTGTGVPSQTPEGAGFPSPHLISTDGSRVLFSHFESGHWQLFMREPTAERTTWISAPEVTPAKPLQDANAAQPIASSDLSRVFFTSKGQLTGDANPVGGDLYMWSAAPDAEGHHLTDLSVDREPADGSSAEVEGVSVSSGDLNGGVVAASDDGSYVYFVAGGQIVPGGPTGSGKYLYLWHEGTTSFIASLSGAALSTWIHRIDPGRRSELAQATPDGHDLLFLSESVSPPALGETEADGHRRAYLYDSATGRLACVSCDPSGQASGSDTAIAPAGGAGLNTKRSISDDGSRVFFTTGDGLVARDVNGLSDVYE